MPRHAVPSIDLGDLALAVRLAEQPAEREENPARRKRRLLARFCRLLLDPADDAHPAISLAGLSTRQRQTLERLLAGDSEKQIAAALSVSPNTIHVYVKALYRHFAVSSRGELLARFVRRTGSGLNPSQD
jgi:DNA-binding NarL/FixJ family response regulator